MFRIDNHSDDFACMKLINFIPADILAINVDRASAGIIMTWSAQNIMGTALHGQVTIIAVV